MVEFFWARELVETGLLGEGVVLGWRNSFGWREFFRVKEFFIGQVFSWEGVGILAEWLLFVDGLPSGERILLAEGILFTDGILFRAGTILVEGFCLWMEFNVSFSQHSLQLGSRFNEATGTPPHSSPATPPPPPTHNSTTPLPTPFPLSLILPGTETVLSITTTSVLQLIEGYLEVN